MVGTVTLQYKKVKPPMQWVRSRYTVHAVGMQCAVGISAKRSTGTVELANMGGGDCYFQVQKGQTPMQWGMQ